MMFFAAIWTLVGCDSNLGNTSTDESVAMIEQISHQGDNNRTLQVVDSLEKIGKLSLGDSYFWQGYVYYRMNHYQTAEFFYQESLNATKSSTDARNLATYARTASYLSSLYCRYSDYFSAMKTAEPVVNRLEELKCDTTSDYTSLLVFIGCCKTYFGAPDSIVTPIFDRAYQMHISNIEKKGTKEVYRDVVVGLVNIIYACLSVEKYEQALIWICRFKEMLDKYTAVVTDDDVYIDKQMARYLVFHAVALEGLGCSKEAAEEYAEYQKMQFSKTLEGQTDAADYLIKAKRWDEAVESYSNIEEHFARAQVQFSLDNIQRYLLNKYQVNVMAGRHELAKATACNICEHLDSAILQTRRMNVDEQETIHQKESLIAQQKERLSKTRIAAQIVVIIALILFFVIFTIIRHRAAKRLAKVNAAKERMEGELSIARNIQMSMVPSTFPDYEGLDMYASMTPAKEVGGDLYGYHLEGDKLYFALGDVSGKGVPASLFMAQATRLFLTLAKQGMMPAEICTSINKALAGEDNVNAMFVTMFIGLLDLKTGHLDFCNAGHNAPVLGGGELGGEFLDMLPNAPIGLWPGLEYEGEELDSIKGRQLFIYTDGLNEAENRQQEQFGDDRLLEILRAIHYENARQVIEAIEAEVEKHRDGAEPNDDLTMMCIKL